MQGHIRSILPQKNGIAPIDQHTTAYFRFNGDSKDMIRAVEPQALNTCLEFNSSETKEYLEAPVVLPENGTIEMWYCPSSFYDYNTLFENSIDPNQWECWIYSTGRLIFRPSTESAVGFDIPRAGEWFHLAVTWEKASGAVELYIDGSRKTRVTGKTWARAGEFFRVGGKDNTKGKGKASDVRIWNRVKSGDEIRESIGTLSTTSTDGLVAHWRLDDGEGKIARDYSSNGQDALVIGGKWTRGRGEYSFPASSAEGIMVEEGTTNIITSPLDPMSWSISNESEFGYYSHEEISTPFGKGLRKFVQGGDYRGTLSQVRWTAPSNMSKRLTTSIYAKTNQPGIAYLHMNYQGEKDDGSRIDIHEYHELTTEWKRYTISKVLADEGFARTIGSMKFYTKTRGPAGSPSMVDLAAPQTEEKNFPTTFIETTRPLSNLQYPGSLFNRPEGTVSFWVKRLNPGDVYEHLFYMGKSDGYTGVISGEIEFHITKDNNQMVVFYVANKGGAEKTNSLTVPAANPKLGEWVHIAVSYKVGSFMRLYYNGEKVGESPLSIVLPDTPSLQEKIYIGRSDHPSIRYGNILMDELRLDRVAREDNEIRAWYYQGRNGV